MRLVGHLKRKSITTHGNMNVQCYSVVLFVLSILYFVIEEDFMFDGFSYRNIGCTICHVRFRK